MTVLMKTDRATLSTMNEEIIDDITKLTPEVMNSIISDSPSGISIRNNLIIFKKQSFSLAETEVAKCLFFGIYTNNYGTMVFTDIRFTSKESLFYFMKMSFPSLVSEEKYKTVRNYMYSQLKEAYEDLFSNFNEQALSQIPFYHKFYEHQQWGVYYGCNRKHNLLAFEQGLGKSITAATISTIIQSRKTLIIQPAVCKWNWFEELTGWGFSKDTITIVDSKKTINAVNEKIILLNYDLVVKYLDLLCSRGIDHLILDECHKIKNPEANRTKAVKHLVRTIDPKITFLSGTPAPNRTEDVFVYLDLIGHPLGKSHNNFMKRFTRSIKSESGRKKVVGGKNIEFLNACMSNFMIRKTKKKCLDLPDKNYIKLHYELEDYQEEYDAAVEEFKKLATSRRKSFDEDNMALNRLNIITSKAKLPYIYEFVKDTINQDVDVEIDGETIYKKKKFVIFASYREPLDYLVEKFGSACIKIDGTVPTEQRQGLINKFKNDDSVSVFLGNITAAGIGINLVGDDISDVLFVNSPYTQAEIDQCTDRLHRIGQRKKINVYYTICKNSIDERINKIVNTKFSDVSKLIDTKVITFDFEDKLISEVINNIE
jgi:SNF2 family DNA or RNA helicase